MLVDVVKYGYEKEIEDTADCFWNIGGFLFYFGDYTDVSFL